MKQPATKFRLLMILLIILIPAQSSALMLSIQRTQFPPRKRGPATIVYLRPGYEILPAQVTYINGGVGEDLLKRGILIKQVGVVSRSSTPIAGVKLSWYFYNQKDPDNILQTGSTPLIELERLSVNENCDIGLGPLYKMPGRFAGGKQKEIDYPILTYAMIEEGMSKGQLTDLEVIEVAVSEVHYEDGRIWEGKDLPRKKNQ